MSSMWMNRIYNSSSASMKEVPSKSVSLMVTSPPYNIDIQYGNRWENGKIIGTKGLKYQDNYKKEK